MTSPYYNIDLSAILRNYLLGLVTCADYLYPHLVAFNYARSLALPDKSQYAFIVTTEPYIESLQILIADAGLSDYIYISTYDEPTYLESDNSVIVFDSLYNLMGDIDDETKRRNLLVLLRKLQGKYCQSLAIIDYNLQSDDVKKLCNLQPDGFIYLSDHAAGTQFDRTTGKLYFPNIKECDITMTKEQEIKINSIIGKEQPTPDNWLVDKFHVRNEKFMDEQRNYISPKKYFNIVYPYNVEKAIKDNYADIETLASIVNLFGPGEILKHSPKFSDVIHNIIMNKTRSGLDNIFARRVIFTAYPNADIDGTDGDFGGDLLWVLLKEYEGLQVACLYDYHSDADKNQIMDAFNNEEFNILITNCNFVKTPKNVDHFHIIDSDLMTAFYMINVMFKKLTYGTDNSNPTLDVHLHYVQRAKTEDVRLTPDSYDFQNLKNYILGLQSEKQKRFDEGWKVQRSSKVERYEIIVPFNVAKALGYV